MDSSAISKQRKATLRESTRFDPYPMRTKIPSSEETPIDLDDENTPLSTILQRKEASKGKRKGGESSVSTPSVSDPSAPSTSSSKRSRLGDFSFPMSWGATRTAKFTPRKKISKPSPCLDIICLPFAAAAAFAASEPGVATPHSSPATSTPVPPEPATTTAPSPSSPRRKKKLASKFKGPSPFSSKFFSKDSSIRASMFNKFSFHSERSIDKTSYSENSDILPLIYGSSLGKTVFKVSGFPLEVVREFYCNLSKETFDPSSSLYERVYVRGRYHLISASRFNKVLGISSANFSDDLLNFDEVISELTDNAISKWPNKKDFRAASLNQKYGLLHKIALCNWLPSRHAAGIKKSLAALLFRIGRPEPINLGKIIFESLSTYSSSRLNTSSLIFPCSIFKLLTSTDDSLAKIGPRHPIKPMKLYPQSVNRVPRSVPASVSTPPPPSEDSNLREEIAMLKAQLEEFKQMAAKNPAMENILLREEIATLKVQMAELRGMVVRLQESVFSNQGGEISDEHTNSSPIHSDEEEDKWSEEWFDQTMGTASDTQKGPDFDKEKVGVSTPVIIPEESTEHDGVHTPVVNTEEAEPVVMTTTEEEAAGRINVDSAAQVVVDAVRLVEEAGSDNKDEA